MATDTNPPAKSKPAEAVEPAEFEQSLEEFCAQLSGTDKRVELIAGFFSAERAAGTVQGLPSAFASRFDAFAHAPA